jgi:hypothetical protein
VCEAFPYMAATITPIAAETRNFIQAAEPWIGKLHARE